MRSTIALEAACAWQVTADLLLEIGWKTQVIGVMTWKGIAYFLVPPFIFCFMAAMM